METVKMGESKKREWSISADGFPFEIAHIGEPANNMDTFHWHDFMELTVIQKGSGKYEIEDKVYHVTKGDVIIINNIEKHRVTYKIDETLYETVIHFDPGLIWSREDLSIDYGYLKLFRYECAAFNNRPELCTNTKNEINNLFMQITEEYTKKSTYYELMIKSKLLTVITLLLRQCRIKPINDTEMISRKNQIERLEKILNYIEENFNRDISLESMARRFFMNASYFSDYFKKNVGINFSEYLAKVRVHEAIKLLTEKDASSTEAAFSSGFNNITSFYNTFKRVTGKNPGDYKRIPRGII